MSMKSTGTPLEDIEFLARSEHRVTILEALAQRPRERSELKEMTGVSPSTIGRTLREFEERRWIKKDGHRYETTQLGAFVATGMGELLERIETERKLRQVWNWLPTEASGFTIEMGSEAVVTVADADDPYRPVNRFLSLLRETDRFRFAGFDIALLAPCKSELCQRIVDGMNAEIIDPPSVINYIRSSCPNEFSETLESGNLTLKVHDDLPAYGLGLFDDRICITGYDPETRTVRVSIDTDAPEARGWAESVYQSYRRETPTLALETNVE